MPPKPPSSSSKKSKPSAPSRASNLKLEPTQGPPAAKKQKVKPLSLSKPPVFDLTGSQSSQSSPGKPLKVKPDVKGKEKERSISLPTDADPIVALDDQMWVDMYEPTTEGELAVHVKKVQDIRQWLVEAFDGGLSGKLRKYRRILVLTGPAGTAKTATLKVLSREMNFEISEWRNGLDDRPSRGFDSEYREEAEGLAERFQAFMARSSSCRSVFSTSLNPGPSQLVSGRLAAKRQVILIEDLPNILHLPTRQVFHAALEQVANSPLPPVSPVVIIISDAGLRGEAGSDDLSFTSGWGQAKEAINTRTVLPPSLLSSPFVTQLGFNPIAPTLMKKALQHLISTHFHTSTHHQSTSAPPSKEILDIIVESSNGDIRSAIMALQFACLSESPGTRRLKKKSAGGAEGRALMEAITRREQSLALFHLVGKLLYNKRKGDPPASSAAKKDIERDKAIDIRLKDPPKLPIHLSAHNRKPSRVDVEALYAESPIDSSLLSLYVHQNYTQYCDEVEECADLIDWLSWVDFSGGEHWYSANPHRFHLISLGTLHSLPSPVTRRSQKSYKPEFFEILKKEREVGDGVIDTHEWIRRDESGRAAGWTRRDVALELGGVLKARETRGQDMPQPPQAHRLFSRLPFTKGTSGLVEFADGVDDPQHETLAISESQDAIGIGSTQEPEAGLGGWLEDDDIEES